MSKYHFRDLETVQLNLSLLILMPRWRLCHGVMDSFHVESSSGRVTASVKKAMSVSFLVHLPSVAAAQEGHMLPCLTFEFQQLLIAWPLQPPFLLQFPPYKFPSRVCWLEGATISSMLRKQFLSWIPMTASEPTGSNSPFPPWNYSPL